MIAIKDPPASHPGYSWDRIDPARVPGHALELWRREAGGGGDCMYHSVAACLSSAGVDGATMPAMREAAASAVTPANAPDALVDMAAQLPASLSAPMSQSLDRLPGFSPEAAWNAAAGDPVRMAELLAAALRGHAWGDATAAALLESALGINIMLLALREETTDSWAERVRSAARVIYGRWVDELLAVTPDADARTDDELIAMLADQGMTWHAAMREAAMSPALPPLATSRRPVLQGCRQPIGAVHELLSAPASAPTPHVSRHGYRADRPTALLLNLGNGHWQPVAVSDAVGASPPITLIGPTSPLRAAVDALLA